MSKVKIRQCEIIFQQDGCCARPIYLECIDCTKKLQRICHSKDNLILSKKVNYDLRAVLAKQYLQKKGVM